MKLSEFLTKFLGGLQFICAEYCILRNYQDFPESNIGNDIDILIAPENVKHAVSILQGIAGIRITGFNERAYVTTVFMEGIYDGKKTSLQIDLVTRLSWKGMVYLDNNSVFADTIAYESRTLIKVPAAHHEALVSLFSSYLLGGWVKERYQESIRAVFQADPQLISTTVDGWAGSSLACQLVDAVCQDDRLRLLAMLPAIKKQLIRTEFRKSPFRAASKILAHYIHELRIRYTDYPIVQICVLGVDGSGKSTIIQAITGQLDSRVKGHEVIHLKPRKRQPSTVTVTSCPDPHAHPPRNNLTSTLKLFSWVFLYHWRKWVHGHSNSTLIIWDRYIYDTLADPLRYRIKLPNQALKLFSYLAPRPEGVIILDVPPEVAYARKQEVALPELHKIRSCYLEFANKFQPSVIVDTSTSLDESCRSAVEFVSETLSAHAARKIRKSLQGN